MIWLILFWVACAVMHCGLHFAHFQRAYHLIRKECYDDDANFALVLSIFGPVALLALLVSDHYRRGFLLPFTKKSKIEAGLV